MDVAAGGSQSPGDVESRHSGRWYEDVRSDTSPQRGDRMFIRCEGGPCSSRLETLPPRMEIPERGGLYVLIDDGPVDGWAYEFEPTFDQGTSA